MGIRFGRHELDEQRFLLQRDEVRLDVRPKVFDLLVLLIRFRERVVLRDELVIALWGTTAVGVGSLSGLVNELRQVLGEAGHGRSSIRTVHGRGYQFVASVDPGEVEAHIESTIALAEIATGQRQPMVMARNFEFSTARGKIRALAVRVPAEGARACIVVGPPGSGRMRVLDDVISDLSNTGFEVHQPIEVNGCDRRPYFLVDRLVASLVESHGVEVIRSAIPVRARELMERIGNQGPLLRISLRDPLASRQYEERVWRSMGELLRILADLSPLALLVDDRKQPVAVAKQLAAQLLRLVGHARIFILIAASIEESEDRLDSADSADLDIDIIRLGALDRSGLNDLLEAQGVAVFPTAIADALVAHVRGDAGSLEFVANWLRAEKHRASLPAVNVESTQLNRRMKRVEPNTGSPAKRIGIA